MVDVMVLGGATTPFVKRSDEGPLALGARAALGALADAGLRPSDVDAVFCGSVHGGEGLGQRIAYELGIGARPVLNLENACSSSSTAALEAGLWIRGELAGVTLVVGVEAMSARAGQPVVEPGGAFDYEAHGISWPVLYALHADEAIRAGDYDEEALATVAVTNRRHAATNAQAQFREELTVEQVLESPMIAPPLRRLMACPRSDGAAAVVLARGGAVSQPGRRGVRISGAALAAGELLDGAQLPAETITTRVADQAYAQAGLGPQDVQVLELHDAFASAQLEHLVSLGICESGGAGDYVKQGRATHGTDAAVVNPGGGLMSRGHPMGATGAAQLVEVSRQLRGEAGAGQVEGARVGLVHTMGGTIFELESNACLVQVLEATS